MAVQMDRNDDLLAGLLAEPTAPRRPPPPRSAPQTRTLLDWLAPEWALRAEREIRTESAQVRSLILVVAVLVFAIGFFGAVGGGYASIQAVRLLAVRVNIPVQVTGTPALVWWLIPIGNTLIQIAARRIAAVRRMMWRPSLWFDGATTGAFLAVPILPGMLALSPQYGLYAAGAVGAILGMGIAIVAEHLILGALVMVRGARQ